jgi:hypothetical protein
MTWPPSPWVIVFAWVLLSFFTVALWMVACEVPSRRIQRRLGRNTGRVRVVNAEWLDDALEDWPGREIDDAILARQIAVARRLRGRARS